MLSRALLALLLFAAPAAASEARYAGVVEQVIDGDTLVVDVPDWPLPFRHARVRIHGIDTPESRRGRSGAKCESELRAGQSVKAWMKRLLPKGTKIKLQWMDKHDKYGRPVMRVFLPDGRNLGREMLRQHLAKSYDGGRKGKWCLPGS
jgi:micrococcal nuclease